MVLTEKEMATIEDLHTQELSCVEKYKRYGQEAKDPVLRDLFADLEKKEQKHVESLEQVMKGSVIDGYTTIIIEEKLDTDLSYVQDLGYTITKTKTYKTNKHVFLKKEGK